MLNTKSTKIKYYSLHRLNFSTISSLYTLVQILNCWKTLDLVYLRKKHSTWWCCTVYSVPIAVSLNMPGCPLTRSPRFFYSRSMCSGTSKCSSVFVNASFWHNVKKAVNVVAGGFMAICCTLKSMNIQFNNAFRNIKIEIFSIALVAFTSNSWRCFFFLPATGVTF